MKQENKQSGPTIDNAVGIFLGGVSGGLVAVGSSLIDSYNSRVNSLTDAVYAAHNNIVTPEVIQQAHELVSSEVSSMEMFTAMGAYAIAGTMATIALYLIRK